MHVGNSYKTTIVEREIRPISVFAIRALTLVTSGSGATATSALVLVIDIVSQSWSLGASGIVGRVRSRPHCCRTSRRGSCTLAPCENTEDNAFVALCSSILSYCNITTQ